MVYINENYQFIVYNLDTQQSAINRLAADMETLPKYLYFPDGIPTIEKFYEEDGNIRVEDLFKIITSEDAGYDFNEIFKQLKDKLSQQNLKLDKDVFFPFIAFNKTLEGVSSELQSTYILMIQNELDETDIFTNKQNIERIWTNREVTKRDITNSINYNKAFSEKEKNVFLRIENIYISTPYTPFEIENIDFNFNLEIVRRVTIMEFFNHIQLNVAVPFACINNIYKILKDFIPLEEWSFCEDSAIIFKVLQNSDLSQTQAEFQDFTDAKLSIIEESGSGKEEVKVDMSLKTSRQNLTQDKLIERVIDTIKGLEEIKVKNISENKVSGIFYFPNFTLNNYVLSDLIMNDPIFSSMISIDESDKASKKKTSIYIHFRHPKIGYLTANITPKVSEKGDKDLRGKDIRNTFKIGTNYVRVKISSARNIKSIETFQEMFSKLMVIYRHEYQNIVNIYRLYINDFDTTQPYIPTEQQNLKLKDIAPEVFVNGYPPKCPYQPTIIEDDEVLEAQEEGKIVMRYPQTNNEGFIPRNYICDHKEAKYPGLRNNPLSNKDQVPFLPCCYTKNQEERKGSVFRHYYYGEDLRERIETKQQDLITTNKFVPNDNYGTLPDNITKLFDIFDSQEGYMYVRKGVFDTKSSFLECVMEGMYEETGIIEFIEKNQRESRLNKERNDNATLSRAALCRQEMYDFNTDEIISAIRDPEVYMDPKLFTSMLEEIYNCNIYVFNRINTPDGQLSIPRHLQAFYKTKRRSKCVFIYEHLGSTSDHATYPRCELIVRWRIGGGTESDVSYYFDYNSKVSKGVRSIFNNMNQTYSLNRKIIEIEFPIANKDVKLINQFIDSYGKCRMISFKYERQFGTLLTSPIQPLNIPEINNLMIVKLDLNTALQFASTIGILISGQSIVRGVVKELHGILGNVVISIPVEDNNPIDGVPILDKGVSYLENDFSVIENYNRYKKLARYITEYIFWLFSKYLQEDSSRDTSLNTINNFFKEKVKIVKDFEYGQVDKIFSMNSGVMYRKKLVVKSEETLKRLVYILRVSLLRFRKKILEYHTHTVIENYYVDVTDFDQHNFQVILQGEKSVEKWINEQNINYKLYNSVQLGLFEVPYFFQNDLVDKNIYLAQNTDDLQKAIDISRTWLEDKYNPGNNPSLSNELFRFTLYRYVNPKDITLFRVSGKPTSLDIKILGYKVGVRSLFTVLLQL